MNVKSVISLAWLLYITRTGKSKEPYLVSKMWILQAKSEAEIKFFSPYGKMRAKQKVSL